METKQKLEKKNNDTILQAKRLVKKHGKDLGTVWHCFVSLLIKSYGEQSHTYVHILYIYVDPATKCKYLQICVSSLVPFSSDAPVRAGQGIVIAPPPLYLSTL